MTPLGTIIAVSLGLALVPLLTFLRNLLHFRTIPALAAPPAPLPSLSVLIPARNEAERIAGAIESVLASRDVSLELLVGDDHSGDATADIVRAYAARDLRVSLVSVPPLPPAWCGKQHACHTLAAHATRDLLVFLDADVRLAPGALARLAAAQRRSGAALVSGFPRQVTASFLDQLLLPLIHLILLGFLPLWRMRRSAHPAYAAGCGQLMLADRHAYLRAGGHAAIRSSLHDGITLPRAFRLAGLPTDLVDAYDLAACHMYSTAGQTWRGLGKNATEGLAAPAMIVPATVLLLGGQVLPPFLLAAALVTGASDATLLLAGAALAASYVPRIVALIRFRQSFLGALLHPLSVLLLLAIQWQALTRQTLGGAPSWRGRTCPTPV